MDSEEQRLQASLVAPPPATVAAASDEQLMMRYRDGEAAAFEQLYRRHKDPLYRYLLRGCAHPDSAAELFQDVWAGLIRSRAGYQPRARFGTWLYRMAHNRLVDHLRLAPRAPLAIKEAEAAVSEAQGTQHDQERYAHLVYLADRKVQTARALAESKVAEDQLKDLQSR